MKGFGISYMPRNNSGIVQDWFEGRTPTSRDKAWGWQVIGGKLGVGGMHRSRVTANKEAKKYGGEVVKVERPGSSSSKGKRRVKNVAKKSKSMLGWIPAVAVKIDRALGKVHILKNPAQKQVNIAQGFYDSDGVFHPIRASSDYEPSWAGEYPVKRKATKKKAKSKRKGPRKNIAQGFYDSDGVFHPIRASSDYEPSWAGEWPSGKKAKTTKRKATTKRRR